AAALLCARPARTRRSPPLRIKDTIHSRKAARSVRADGLAAGAGRCCGTHRRSGTKTRYWRPIAGYVAIDEKYGTTVCGVPWIKPPSWCPHALLQRRELHRDDDLGFLMQQRTKLLVLAQKIMPGRILGHFGATPGTVVEVRKAPEMNHLIE